jgi:hypothetical protein
MTHAMSVRTCRLCGCADDDCSGCIERTGEPCHWVEPDLCSACMPPGKAFPEGWQLGAESWSFHREFFCRVGRPTIHGEYTGIRVQIQYRTGERLGPYHYRVVLRDGTPLIVRGNWHRLLGVEPTGWTPKPPKPARIPAITAPQSQPLAEALPPKPPEPSVSSRHAPALAEAQDAAVPKREEPERQARAPPVAEPPPRRPLRASTLTLSNPAAAQALAERLRRFGVPEQAFSQAPQP